MHVYTFLYVCVHVRFICEYFIDMDETLLGILYLHTLIRLFTVSFFFFPNLPIIKVQFNVKAKLILNEMMREMSVV